MQWLDSIINGVRSTLPEAESLWFSGFSIGSGDFRIITKKQMQAAFKSNPLVFMVCDKQAEVVSSLPTYFADKKGDPVEAAKESALWEKPNPETSGKDFRHEVIKDLVVYGEAFVYGLRSVGFGSSYNELHALPAIDTEPILDGLGKPLGYSTVLDGEHTVINGTGDVLHIKMPVIENVGGKKLRSKLSALGEAVSSSTAMLETEAFIFQNRGISKILTNDSDLPLTKTEKKELNDEFQKLTGGVTNAGKAYLTNAKLRSIDLLQSPADLNLDEGLYTKMRIIAGVYGLDSKIFGDPSASTYNNMKEAVKAAYNQVFIPLCEAYIIEAFNAWLFQGNLNTDARLTLDYDSIQEIRTAEKDFADTELVRMNSVAQVLAMQTTREGKLALLVNDLGYSEEQAENVLGAEAGADYFRNMPPAIASRLIDKLEPEELRNILNL